MGDFYYAQCHLRSHRSHGSLGDGELALDERDQRRAGCDYVDEGSSVAPSSMTWQEGGGAGVLCLTSASL